MEIEVRAKQLVEQMTLGEKISQLIYNSPAIERLGIDSYNWWNECLHGVGRAGTATVFPQPIGLAATFHTKLIHEIAVCISDEARAKHHAFAKHHDRDMYKGLTFWSPNINILRDPRWGRGHETYGEDPYLTAQMGIAFVKGLQGDENMKYRKCDATLKHFAAHSGPELGRHGFHAIVSKKDLAETYLYAFERCVKEAKPSAVMGAYNRLNGEACCASQFLLQDVLRKDWKFEGYVVSDCGAICDINEHHHITETMIQSSALALRCGCELNCGHAYYNLMAAYEAGLVSEETITHAVVLLMTARLRLGMFDCDNPYSNIPYDVVSCDLHRQMARNAASEGIVLLKNNGVLPLSRELSCVAVIGPNANDRDVLLGNYNGTPMHTSTVLDGILNHVKAHTKVLYSEGCHITKEASKNYYNTPYTEALIVAEQSDVVILCLGLNPRIEGEEGDAFNSDAGGDRTDIALPLVQQKLFEEVRKSGKKIVLVSMSGSCIAFGKLAQECDAILQAFYPGQEAGNAIADILFGDVNPSGRLPITFYASIEDLPPFEDYAMEGRTYRFFGGIPLFPFGHGLSYTTFEYSEFHINSHSIDSGQSICASVCIKNTGQYDGYEVAQLYLKDHEATTRTPQHKLIAFQKVFIPRNEQVFINFEVKPQDMMLYDEDGTRILQPGAFSVYVGGGQPGFTTVLKKTFQVT